MPEEPVNVEEWFDNHLKYRTRVLLAHYKMSHTPEGEKLSWTASRGPMSWLEACFEAGLVNGRMYLNFLGLSVSNDGPLRKIDKRRDDEVGIEHFGGACLDPLSLSESDRRLFHDFLVMANKGGAHFTKPRDYDLSIFHETILRIHAHLETSLYLPHRRSIEPLNSRGKGVNA